MLEKPRVSQYDVGRRSKRGDEESNGMLGSAGESNEESGILVNEAVRGDGSVEKGKPERRFEVQELEIIAESEAGVDETV